MNEAEFFEEDISNPLDSVEEILCSHEWVFSRTTPDELVVDIEGRYGNYRMLFYWQDEFCALQFACQYDFAVSPENMDHLPAALMCMNADLWLGHFDFDPQTRQPVFRYNILFRGMTQTSGGEHIEDLVDIALSECERFNPSFRVLSDAQKLDEEALQLSLMTTAGES